MRSYFSLCWRKSPVNFDELSILGEIHGPLRARILRHVGALIRAEIPILQVRTDDFADMEKADQKLSKLSLRPCNPNPLPSCYPLLSIRASHLASKDSLPACPRALACLL